MSDETKSGNFSKARSAKFDSLPPAAQERILGYIKTVGSQIGHKLAGVSGLPPENLLEQIKLMSDEEMEALLDAAQATEAEDLKRLFGGEE